MANVRKYEECHKFIEGIEHKLCSICDKWKPCTLEHFYAANNKTDGLYPYCKTCSKEKSYNRILNNYEDFKKIINKRDKTPQRRKQIREFSTKYRETGRYNEWQQENPEKTRNYRLKYELKKFKITQKEWDACRLYFNYRCAYCGITWEEHMKVYETDLNKEHAINLGINDLSNCIPSCTQCNSEKHEQDHTTWYTLNNLKFNEDNLHKIIKWLQEDHKKYIRVKNKKS